MTAPGSAPARLVVDALAVYRLTRLVTEDVLLDPFREAVIRWAYTSDPEREHDLPDRPTIIDRAGPDAWQDLAHTDHDPPRLATLVQCRWCAGVWVALGVVFVARRFRWWPAMADALACSAVAGLAARLEP